MKANARCTVLVYENKTLTREGSDDLGDQLESVLYFIGDLIHVQKEENAYNGARQCSFLPFSDKFNPRDSDTTFHSQLTNSFEETQPDLSDV